MLVPRKVPLSSSSPIFNDTNQFSIRTVNPFAPSGHQQVQCVWIFCEIGQVLRYFVVRLRACTIVISSTFSFHVALTDVTEMTMEVFGTCGNYLVIHTVFVGV